MHWRLARISFQNVTSASRLTWQLVRISFQNVTSASRLTWQLARKYSKSDDDMTSQLWQLANFHSKFTSTLRLLYRRTKSNTNTYVHITSQIHQNSCFNPSKKPHLRPRYVHYNGGLSLIPILRPLYVPNL